MFELTPVEIVGYVASALIVASLAMSSVVRLRILSLTGSIVFIAYGVLIGSLPILITNLAIACINIWYLRLELGQHHDLDAVEARLDSPFVADFIEHHLDDMRRFQPDASIPEAIGDGATEPVVILLIRDGLPAGLLVGTREGSTLRVSIDYVIGPYRDSRLGQWLYGPGAEVFTRAGFTRLVSEPGDDTHGRYLAKVGFRLEDGDYVLELSPQPR
jgi:hypothetical protein